MPTHCLLDDSIEGGVSTGEGEGEEAGLSREHKVIHVQGTVSLVSKQQEQILEHLSQYEGVHSIQY